MTTACLPWRRSWLTAIAVCGALGVNAAHGQAPPEEAPAGTAQQKPAPPVAPPEIIKPALPSELKDPDAVFRQLDVARRGYLTRDDTRELIGFGDAFRAADPKRSGKLTRGQFRKAWSIYRSAK